MFAPVVLVIEAALVSPASAGSFDLGERGDLGSEMANSSAQTVAQTVDGTFAGGTRLQCSGLQREGKGKGGERFTRGRGGLCDGEVRCNGRVVGGHS